jgi:DNA-binding response OmpR family regulator
MNKILVIEDDADIAEIIALALAGKHIVKATSDCQGLVNLIQDFQPDLIMIDYYIGQKKAAEIVEEIRTDLMRGHLPFILFSGHQDIERLAYEMGASAWLAKPFTLADLSSCIENVLSQHA